ncbi:DUF4188 domain-containing protein [Micromonospora sp. R77]|uniref:DUF4188 domain-containing protein n=1 Tax=Micromonospora sp. R77 TaxID=2925836 RepID=UPI001F60C8C4|nr:DUF4188 domain-containing protein [Micromonospora sp. R77]MCI4066480.1 DUF4188 domain-containing protein [Micromonospora sp. R77]
MTAEIEGDFAVFITGMRINRYWKIHKWYPNFRDMRKILMALFSNQEEYGALCAHHAWTKRGPILIGYFRSVEQLEKFANDPNQPHAEVWARYFKRMKGNGDVGVWHETFVVRSGEYESVYVYMPPTGLAMGTSHVPVERRGDLAADRRATGARAAAAAAAKAEVVQGD